MAHSPKTQNASKLKINSTESCVEAGTLLHMLWHQRVKSSSKKGASAGVLKMTLSVSPNGYQLDLRECKENNWLKPKTEHLELYFIWIDIWCWS